MGMDIIDDIYEVVVEVVEVSDKHVVNYKSGDKFRIKSFYIDPKECNTKFVYVL
ncbi:MAG: hypothetical protein QXE01_06200 [Sulfolobales archaeon]